MPITKGRSKGAALPQRPIWMTEQGGYTSGTGGNEGVLNGRRGARWVALMYFAQNIVSHELMTVETAPYWYDVNHGFDSQPVWWRINMSTGGGAMGPQLLPVRTMQAEIYGKKFSKELDFGKYGKNMYIGGKWIAPDGSQVLGICGTSYGLPAVNLAVTGATSVTLVDGWGNTSSLAVTGGVASFPTSEFPQWIRLPAGVNAELVASDWAWGKNYTTQARVTVSSTQAKAYNLVDETLRNIYDYDNSDLTDPVGAYYDGTMSYPQTLKWDYGRTITLDQIALFSSVPWQESSAFTDFTVDISTDNSSWTNVYTHAAPSDPTVTTTSGPWRTTYDSYWNEDWCWLIQFAASSARYVRVVVNATSYGNNFNSAAQTVEYGAAHNYLVCEGMHSFYRGGTNPDKTTAFSDPRDIPGCWAWWDATDNSTLTLVSTTHCSVWNDKAGYGLSFTQSTDANRPVTGTNINGHQALTFNGTSSEMRCNFPITPKREGTVFIVARTTTGATAPKGMLCSDLGGYILSGNNKIATDGGIGIWEIGAGAVTTNQGFIYTFAENGAANGECWLAQDGTGVSSTEGHVPNPLPFFMVGSVFGTLYFVGQIGEIIVYDHSLSSADRQTVESYLRTKWGTP